MYGGCLAENLFDAGKKVLVLEAGPLLVPVHVQNLPRLGFDTPNAILPQSADAQSTRNLVWGIPWRGNQIFPGLAYCVGGKSLYWGGWSPRLTDDVLMQWPQEVRDYLVNNYERVEKQTGVFDDTDFVEGSLTATLRAKVDAAVPQITKLDPSESAPLAVQGQSPASGLFSFDKYSSTPLLIEAIREDVGNSGGNDAFRRLFLVPRAHVTRLVALGGTVSELHAVVNGENKIMPISPGTKIVLAMSTIESTRLALESFPTPLMGRNLMVHLRSNIAVRIKRSAFAGLDAGPLETAALHVPGHAQNGGRFHLQLTAAANPNSDAEAVWFRTIYDIDLLSQILANQDALYIAIAIRGCGEMVGHKDHGSPASDVSWIDLSPYEFDEHGMRRAFVHLKTTQTDEELWNVMDGAALDLLLAIANHDTSNIEYFYGGQWQTDPPPQGLLNYEGGVRDPLGTTYHESGTLWMGDPGSSVTDVHGRFHHISNAYCADQSLFPTVGSANPALTGMVLAQKVAEAI
jgi:choline dehydrogenase-like flavoprotein